MLNIPLYSQSDPRWASKKMSPSSLTLGSYGCLVSCFSMALANYAVDANPGKLTDSLVPAGAFTPGGELIFNGVAKAYPQVRVVGRPNTTNLIDPNLQKMQVSEAVRRIRRLIDLGNMVPIWVDAVHSDKRPDHWVLAVAFSNDDFVVHDPGFGEIAPLSKRYGDYMKAIYGYCAVVGPSINFANDAYSKDAQVAYRLSQAASGIDVTTNVRQAFDVLIG